MHKAPIGTLADAPRFPDRPSLMLATLQALRELGGVATVNEINDAVMRILRLPGDLRRVKHRSGGRAEFGYRCAWARTHLKQRGLVN